MSIPTPNQLCPVCQKPYGNDIEEHHIIPISYGGDKNGKTVFLHSSCHFNIHKTAESLTAKTVKPKDWFNDKLMLQRAAPYIKEIIDAKRRYEEGETDIYKPRRKMIVVQLSDYEWRRIKKVSKDKGYSNVIKFIEEFLRSLTKF